MYFINIFNYLS